MQNLALPGNLRMNPLLAGSLLIGLAFLVVTSVGCSDPAAEGKTSHTSLWSYLQSEPPTQEGDQANVDKKFSTTIRKPAGPPVIHLTDPDPQGRIGTLACSTCHSVREPNPNTRRPADLDQFHQGMQFSHGNLACLACHNSQNYDTLHLSDGSTVEYPDVMNLCAQCHGSQATSFEKGAHGGMNGYWDLNQGPRTRNNCIDCHNPHQPKFPKMVPTFKPRDRFLAAPTIHTAPTSHKESAHE